MDEIKEFVKANLQAIVDELERCWTDPSIHDFVYNPAFVELKRIANDKHDVAACFAGMVHGMGLEKSVSYITAEDMGKPLPAGIVMRITAEYVPESECEKSAS